MSHVNQNFLQEYKTKKHDELHAGLFISVAAYELSRTDTFSLLFSSRIAMESIELRRR